MSGVFQFTGETEFTRIEVELEDQGPEEWPTIGVTVRPLDSDDEDLERSLVLSLDEARQVIAGLAAVVR